MRSLVDSLIGTARYLNVFRTLPEFFNEEERRLVFQSAVIGLLVGLVTFFLKRAVDLAFTATLGWLKEAPSVLLVLLPLLLGALIVAAISRSSSSLIYHWDNDGQVHELVDVEGDGLERAISLYYTSEPSFERALMGQEGVEVRWQLPTFTLAARKFLATLITLGSGGSGGLGASGALIGESLSAGLFKPTSLRSFVDHRAGALSRLWQWWRVNDTDDLQTAQLSGIAAAMAVLLGTPFAAAFFATEVMYRRRPIVEKLVYSLISALVAFFLANVFTAGHPTIFEVDTLFVPPSDLRYYGVLTLMAAAVALVSLYFSFLRPRFERVFLGGRLNIWQRHCAGAAATGLVAVLVVYVTGYFDLTDYGLELVLGRGETVIGLALAGELSIVVALIALGAKMVATLTTIGSGGSAGLLVPSLFLGTMVAAVFADLFDYEPIMLIVPAMTASLIAIVNVPLAAILFAVEGFGSVYMVPALLVLVVTSILAHKNTIYRTQREKYNQRQIMPGVSVHRVTIPPSWVGHTVVELDLRRRFDLNVIGLMEREGKNGLPRVRLGTASTTPLAEGDILVVLGRDEKLNVLEAALREEWQR